MRVRGIEVTYERQRYNVASNIVRPQMSVRSFVCLSDQTRDTKS